MRFKIFVLTISLVLVSQLSHSQEMDSSDWDGYLIRSNKNEKEPVKFDIGKLSGTENREYKITMIHNDQDYEFENLIIMENKIAFNLDTGTLYGCELIQQEDGSFSGNCTRPGGNEGNKIFIVMTPGEQEQSVE